MASNTSNLGLLKKDPLTDGKDTFNIRTMLNDNWDKIDEFAGKTIPISRGGTGATTAEQALANLGGIAAGAVGNLHVWERVQDGVTDYLTSTDRNAYTDGTVGNTTITYLGQLGGGARIEVVSYVGTGTYGVNNPCSITADFKIKAVLYVAEMRDGRLIPGSASYYDTDSMFSDILTTNFIVGKGLYCGEPGYYNIGYGKKSADGKTFYWYSSKDAESQLNYSSSTYFLVVIS